MRISLAALCLVACDANHPPAQAGETLALGQLASDGSFVPYNDGQDVTLVAGAQGGFHVWLSYQMTPARGGEATLERTAHLESDDQLVLRTMGQVELDGAPSQPLPMFMCPAPVGISVLAIPIVYSLAFSDDSGEIARGQVTLIPHCPTDQLEFCQRICNG